MRLDSSQNRPRIKVYASSNYSIVSPPIFRERLNSQRAATCDLLVSVPSPYLHAGNPCTHDTYCRSCSTTVEYEVWERMTAPTKSRMDYSTFQTIARCTRYAPCTPLQLPHRAVNSLLVTSNIAFPGRPCRPTRVQFFSVMAPATGALRAARLSWRPLAPLPLTKTKRLRLRH